jgi:hypothetical protein
MSSKAFWLLASVIAVQLALSAVVIVGCSINKNNSCTDGKVARSLESIVAQCFALYAAETSISQIKND